MGYFRGMSYYYSIYLIYSGNQTGYFLWYFFGHIKLISFFKRI